MCNTMTTEDYHEGLRDMKRQVSIHLLNTFDTILSQTSEKKNDNIPLTVWLLGLLWF